MRRKCILRLRPTELHRGVVAMNAVVEMTQSQSTPQPRKQSFFVRHREMSLAAIILILLLGIYLTPLLQTHSEQDACSFGPVSNERYRELLAEAKQKQVSIWPPLAWNRNETEMLLKQRFDDLSRGMTSVYERLAAMHAVLRAMRADYRRSGLASLMRIPKCSKRKALGFMPFEYHIDLNRLGFLFPFRRQLVVIGRLAVRDNPVGPNAEIHDAWRHPIHRPLSDALRELRPRSSLGTRRIVPNRTTWLAADTNCS